MELRRGGWGQLPRAMNKKLTCGHRSSGGCFLWAGRLIAAGALSLNVLGLWAQTSTPSDAAQDSQPIQKRAALSQADISRIRSKADAGDAAAQVELGRAYRDGNGVAQNDQLAAEWYRRAADQGDAAAQNEVGNLYRLGRGVSQNKEEAVRWYAKAAKNGNAIGMFNLGTCYYNGDGVPPDEFTAYAWFLLAQDGGDKAADDAVQRSSAPMSPKEKADAFIQIAQWYEEGKELPHDDAKSLRWLQMAAPLTPQAKVRLATHLVNEPQPEKYYGAALDACKKAAEEKYPPGVFCVGYMYRKGWGVPQDAAEALKWYAKAAAYNNPAALMESAQMYATGDGTTVDRVQAFLLLLTATQIGVQGARQKATELFASMDKNEIKRVEGKLRGKRLDPKKVLALFKAPQS